MESEREIEKRRREDEDEEKLPTGAPLYRETFGGRRSRDLIAL
jgi:hypothetical protein